MGSQLDRLEERGKIITSNSEHYSYIAIINVIVLIVYIPILFCIVLLSDILKSLSPVDIPTSPPFNKVESVHQILCIMLCCRYIESNKNIFTNHALNAKNIVCMIQLNSLSEKFIVIFS